MKRAGLAMAITFPLLLCGWGSSDVVHVKMSLGFETGELVPYGLLHPETWVYLGAQTDSQGNPGHMFWIRPLNVVPRAMSKEQAIAALKKAGNPLQKPLEKETPEFSEAFEFYDLPRPKGTAQQYFEERKQQLLQACPSAALTPIAESDAELLFEMKVTGCAPTPDQDEICLLYTSPSPRD